MARLSPIIGVYMIRRVGSEECYVGQSVDIEHRFQDHRSAMVGGYHHAKRMQRVHNRRGADAFDYIVLETGFERGDREALTAAEQAWIDVAKPCYNAIMDVYAPREYPNEAVRENVSRGRKGIKPSEETRARMSASHMGNKCRAGKPHSPEQKDLRRVQMMGNSHNLGKKRSPEHRAEMSERMRGNKRRLGHSPGIKGRHHTEEAKARMSASRKATWVRQKAEMEAANGGA